MSRMDSLRSWESLKICSVFFAFLISLAKADNPFLVCLPPFGEGDKTCYKPSTHYSVWNFCDQECKNDHLEFALIAEDHTWLDITLKLLRQGDVYWIAASRKANNWYWSNGTSLSPQLLENVHSENNGSCLSLNVTKVTRSLQSRNCQEYSLCLCQEFQRGILTSPSSTFKPTTQQYFIPSDRLTSTIPTTSSFQTHNSIKVSTEIATTTQQSETTIVSSHTKFCKSTSGGNTCYYYYKELLNKSDATAFCKRLEKEMFHFDNDDATEQFVQETLKNIDGGIWLGAIKLNTDWIWLNGRTFTNDWTNSIFSTDTAYENSSCLIMVPSIQTLARMGCQKIFSVLCQDTGSTGPASLTQSESKATTTELAVVATTTETTTKFQPSSTAVNYDRFYELIPPTKSVQTLYITKTITEITSAKNEQSGTTSDKHEIHTSHGFNFGSTFDSSNDNFKWPMTSVPTTYTLKTSAGISRENSQQHGNVSGNPFPILMPGIEERDKIYFISSKQELSWDLCTKYCKNYVMEFAVISHNNTWINLVLRLVSYGRIYWVAARRNENEWRWVNETSPSQQFLRQFILANHGDCLSLDLPRNPNSLQPRPCLEKHFCLCQKYLRASDNNATSMASHIVTSTPRAHPSYVLKTSTSPIKSV